MEDPASAIPKQQQQSQPCSNPGSSGKSKLLRYALRSGTKPKEEKTESSNPSSASRRGRTPSSVSKSVGVLDISGKEKSSAKPPRRLSIPTKSSATPAPRFVGNVTPIPEVRSRRFANTQAKSETPVSDISRSSNRKKFNILASASYWKSQIKLSESAAQHSVSLGFFKLALEAGCELPRMREELKSYARRYSLSELGETLKELLEAYGVEENPEQLQVSETCSHIPDEGTKSSDEDVRSSSSSIRARNLKPKTLNTDKELAKEPRKNNSSSKATESVKKVSSATRSIPDRGSQKKPQKLGKSEDSKEKEKIQRPGRKTSGVVDIARTDTIEDKENMDVHSMEETDSTEVAA